MITDKHPSEIIADIMKEIDDGKMSDDEIMENAEKIREERINKRKAEEEIKSKVVINEEIKRSKEEFEESIKELKNGSLTEWTRDDILKELKSYPNLRIIYFNVAVNQPTMNLMIRLSLGFEESFRTQISAQLKKLRRMGLIKEILVCEPYWKDYFNKKYKTKFKLSNEEKHMLKKLNIKETTEERKKNVLIGSSGFWVLTKLGEELIPIARGVCV